MSNWSPVGDYIGRGIYLTASRTFSCPFTAGSLQDALLLVVLNTEFDKDAHGDFISALIATDALAITFYGRNAVDAFNMLIDMLSVKSPGPHIMTNLLDGEPLREALVDFVTATWPSENRFDNWEKYWILLIGDSVIQTVEDDIRMLYA